MKVFSVYLVTVWLPKLFTCGINRSPPACVHVKSEWSYTSATHMSLWYREGKLFVCFFLGNSPASEFYMPTFRDTLFRLHRRISISSHLPAYEDGTEFSETSAYKIQTAGNYPEESKLRSEHGESLKSRDNFFFRDADLLRL